MHRYRWFEAQWPFSIRTMAGKLKALAFNDNSSTGFVVDRVRDDYLEARYIERNEYSDTVTDPFGKETIFLRTEFLQTYLKISNGIFGLELIDYPRSNQSLFSRLSEISNFRVFFNSPNVDVIVWAREFSICANTPSIIDSVQIGALSMGDGIVAKAIVKGANDVSNATRELTEGRKHSIDKVQVRLSGRFHGKVVLSANGSAKVDVDHHEMVTDLLRASLVQAINYKN